MTENRITDLESRIAWQEVSLEEMHQVVLDQSRTIERLERGLTQLQMRLQEMIDSGGGASSGGHELPPHY